MKNTVWRYITSGFILFLLTASTAFAADVQTVVRLEVASVRGYSEEADWIARAILYESSRQGVDPLLVTAMMEQESGFQLQAVSPAGAIGLMQLMPDTAAMLGVNPYQPLENIQGGVMYLKGNLDRFTPYGAWKTTYAVAAYNAGPQAVIEYGGVPPYTETVDYVKSIAAIYQRLNDLRG